MLSEAQRHECLLQIERLPLALEATLRGLTEEQLDVAVEDGGWSVRQLVHHMADAHAHGYANTKAILTEERPTLNGWVSKAWAQLADAALPISVSMWILRGVHGRWTRLLRSLPESAWSRTAVDSDGRELTLDDLLQSYAEGGRTNVEKINTLRDRLGW
jgi:hypothetical protein